MRDDASDLLSLIFSLFGTILLFSVLPGLLLSQRLAGLVIHRPSPIAYLFIGSSVHTVHTIHIIRPKGSILQPWTSPRRPRSYSITASSPGPDRRSRGSRSGKDDRRPAPVPRPMKGRIALVAMSRIEGTVRIHRALLVPRRLRLLFPQLPSLPDSSENYSDNRRHCRPYRPLPIRPFLRLPLYNDPRRVLAIRLLRPIILIHPICPMLQSQP